MATKTNHIICSHCGGSTPPGDAARCVHCGAGVRLLEPLAVECGWCGYSNRRDKVDKCTNCGGFLPALPGGNPGPCPPDIPRELPRGYKNRILYWKNVNFLIGFCFTIIFCWTIIFPLIGIPLWIIGTKRARRKLSALQHGNPTRGRVTSCEVDTTQAINNRHPWRIVYEFDVSDGQTSSGIAIGWDQINQKRKENDVMWIVFTQNIAINSAIWPPIH